MPNLWRRRRARAPVVRRTRLDGTEGDRFDRARRALIVARHLADAIEAEALTGVEFLPVTRAARKAPDPRFQWMRIVPELEPLAPSSVVATEDQCLSCGRAGHFDAIERVTELRYAGATAPAGDFNSTWEVLWRLASWGEIGWPGRIVQAGRRRASSNRVAARSCTVPPPQGARRRLRSSMAKRQTGGLSDAHEKEWCFVSSSRRRLILTAGPGCSRSSVVLQQPATITNNLVVLAHSRQRLAAASVHPGYRRFRKRHRSSSSGESAARSHRWR